MFGVIDFYETSEKGYQPGQIWADQPVYMPPRHALKFTRVDQDNDRELDFEIVGRTDDVFDHPPIHSIRLESTEAAVVTRTKRNRPVIIVGGSAASELRPEKHPTHLDVLWTVPVYGASNYSEEIRRRIQVYDFANLFYLPASKAPQFAEGFARLDHAQPVRRDLLRTHRGLRLTEDALGALREWMVSFMTEQIEPDSLILQYRAEQTGD
ncbi:MAG: hypothetical protein AABM43_06860 [Actinomycetota bacterium]